MTIKALMKKIIDKLGRINDTRGMEPMIIPVVSAIPKSLRIEYTISTYRAMVPITMSIQAASLVFDQSTMAKKAAKAPKKSRLEV
jgi:hypothetical protein